MNQQDTHHGVFVKLDLIRAANANQSSSYLFHVPCAGLRQANVQVTVWIHVGPTFCCSLYIVNSLSEGLITLAERVRARRASC